MRYPASLQLVLAFNPCPCGNLGRESHACVCSTTEIHRYWRRVGGALLDRIDLRVPLAPVSHAEMCNPVPSRETTEARGRVREAIARQKARHAGLGFWENGRIPAGLVERFCGLMARTVADLAGAERIAAEHLAEAIQHRRYGDGDFFCTKARS